MKKTSIYQKRWRHKKTKQQRKLEKLEKKLADNKKMEVSETETYELADYDVVMQNRSLVQQMTYDFLVEKRSKLGNVSASEYAPYTILINNVNKNLVNYSHLEGAPLDGLREFEIRLHCERLIENNTFPKYEDFWFEMLNRSKKILKILKTGEIE